MRIQAMEITDIDFTPFGHLLDMRKGGKGIKKSSGVGWTDCFTLDPLIDTQASLGNTCGSASPFTAKEMERHFHTQEALFCMDEPIVFLLATPGLAPQPKAEDIRAVILRPGQAVVLERMVWHSSAHGLTRQAYYYWSAHSYEGEPTEWQLIDNGPVEVYIK